jgi:hypothetical protein
MVALAREVGADVDFGYACDNALKEEYGHASYTVEKGGLRVHPGLGHAAFFIEADGVLIPWSAIDRNLTASGVLALRASK